MLLTAVYLPALAAVLGLERPDATAWALIGISSVVPAVVGQLLLRARWW
jgi:hypothetical protein